jgi:ABC-type nitrate/sulfonate/bicarbonate transport system permease component
VSSGGDKPTDDKPAAAPAAGAVSKAPVAEKPAAAEKPPTAEEKAAALAALEALGDDDAVTKPAPAKVAPAAAPVAAKPAAPPAAKPKVDDKAPPKAKAKEPPPEDPNKIPDAPAWWRTLRADPPPLTRTALGVGLIVFLILLWWVLTLGDPVNRIVSPSKLPSPSEVFGSLGRLMDRKLIESIIDTLERVVLGVGLAAIVGVSLGVIAGAHRGIGATMMPLVIFLRSVPMGALTPLTLMLFGDGEKQKSLFLFLAIVPFVFSDSLKAISIVPERYVETAQTLGASRMQIMRKVLVPLALPDIITSLRFQFGLGLGYITLAEQIDTERGLGALITGSEKRGLFEHIYLLLFVIAFLAFTIDLILRTVQRGSFPWRKDL